VKIKTKILFTVILLSLFINVIATNLYINEKKNDLFNTLHLKMEKNSQLSKQINSKLLYNYDIRLIKINLEYFFNDKDVVYIELKDAFDDVDAHIKFTEQDYDKDKDKDKNIEKITLLEFGDVFLGTIITHYSTRNIDQELSKSIKSIGVSFILVTLLISLALYILLNKFTKPITDLTKVSSLIASGNLEETVNVRSNDEIGVLSKSFEYMRVSLKERIELISIQKEKIEIFNINLQNKVDERTEALSQQTKKVTDLLNNAAQGFLSFDKDFLVDKEYSVECEYLLGKDLKGKDITQLLFASQSRNILLFKENILDALDANNELTSSLILSLLPDELIINKRAVLVKYKIISDEKIMLILTNVTEKKKLQNKMKKEQQIHKMIVSIVSDSSQFYEIKNNFKEFCKNVLLYVNRKNTVIENANIINALVHTHKGLFAQLYMERTVQHLHHFESDILSFTENAQNDNSDLKQFIEIFDLKNSMNEDLDVIMEVLGKSFIHNDVEFKIDEKVVANLEKNIISLCTLNTQHKEECTVILNEIKKIKHKSLKYYLLAYQKLCQQLCLGLNKSIYAVEIYGSSELYITDKYKPFINSLIHIFRNCCDHGIETKEDRVSLNKNETGTIKCSFELKDNNLYMEISDDGKGIDIEGLKKKIVQKELVSKQELHDLSEKDIIDFIFHDNFSTNDSVTHISGRGIGLSVVKAEIIKINGDIYVETHLNKGTLFKIRLPFSNGNAI